MNEIKKQIGVQFRNKRQEMNLSLKEVENATSIKMIYLKSVEEGNIDKYLSPVYALGFIRQYATFLGLDGEKILQQNPKAFTTSLKNQEFDYGIGTLEVRNPQSSNAKSFPNAVWLALGVVFLIGAFFFARAVGLF